MQPVWRALFLLSGIAVAFGAAMEPTLVDSRRSDVQFRVDSALRPLAKEGHIAIDEAELDHRLSQAGWAYTGPPTDEPYDKLSAFIIDRSMSAYTRSLSNLFSFVVACGLIVFAVLPNRAIVDDTRRRAQAA